MSTAYRIMLETSRANGTGSSSKLFETDNWSHSRRALRRVEKALDIVPRGRVTKKVEIVSVDFDRLSRFVTDKRWLASLTKIFEKAKYFASIPALANAIGANPVALRVALSVAGKTGLTQATVRGVTFKYTDHV